MKHKFLSVMCLFLYLLFTACEKTNWSTNVIIKVTEDGEHVEQPVVYIKSGATADPGIPLTQYERCIGGDAIGEVYVKNLPPDHYYIFVKGYSPSLKKVLSGGQSFTLKKNHEFNTRRLTVSLSK